MTRLVAEALATHTMQCERHGWLDWLMHSGIDNSGIDDSGTHDSEQTSRGKPFDIREVLLMP